jgi:uncharacterized protein (DUF433 family)
MVYQDRISIDPRIRSGQPCIKGTRIAVADELDYLGGDILAAEILEDFPDQTADDIQSCLTFAAERERRMVVAA